MKNKIKNKPSVLQPGQAETNYNTCLCVCYMDMATV